jgi:hypothetical protein
VWNETFQFQILNDNSLTIWVRRQQGSLHWDWLLTVYLRCSQLRDEDVGSSDDGIGSAVVSLAKVRGSRLLRAHGVLHVDMYAGLVPLQSALPVT